MEIERGLGLVDQRRDVADVDRLVQVDELPDLPQPIEELAEILLHAGALVVGGCPLWCRQGYRRMAGGAIHDRVFPRHGIGTTLRA